MANKTATHQHKRQKLALTQREQATLGGPSLPRVERSFDVNIQSSGDTYDCIAHSSSLFELKLDHLLETVQPVYHKMPHVDDTLRELKRCIDKIPDHEPTTITQGDKLMKARNIYVPWPEPRPSRDAAYTVSYRRPSSIFVFGSYARRSALRSRKGLTVDLAITMPSNLFEAKDYLNHRYFYKRAYFLAAIADGITNRTDRHFTLEFSYQNDNPLQPILIANPKFEDPHGPHRSDIRIRLLIAADANLFPAAKLHPARNCIRTAKLSESRENVLKPPTAFYNASLRSECLSMSYLKFLHSTSMKADTFPAACVLGSVWLQQRGFGSGRSGGGFGPFEWACTIALLMQLTDQNGRPILSKGYSHYQTFKATLQYLAHQDLVSDPAIVKPGAQMFPETAGPILFDGARGMNILFKMSQSSYSALKCAAKASVNSLSDSTIDQFESCFIMKLHVPTCCYDYTIELPIGVCKDASSNAVVTVFDAAERSSHLYRILHEGLGDRARLVDIRQPATRAWSIDSPAKNDLSDSYIQVGVLLTADVAFRTVDKGPLADDKEKAARFRAFWGEKAELRRFNDGTIHETLSWIPQEADQSVLARSIRYMIERHLSKEAARSIRMISEYQTNMISSERTTSSSDVLGSSRRPSPDLDNLLQRIQNLEGLPLNIRQVTSVDPPISESPDQRYLKHDSTPEAEPLAINIQFQGSSRWPQDLIAVQKAKVAFLLKVAEQLEATTPGLSTSLRLEDDMNLFSNAATMVVSNPAGSRFQLRVHHEGEESLVLEILARGSNSNLERGMAAAALSDYKQKFFQGPMHRQALSSLSSSFPALSASVGAMKKWRDRHLLSNHVSDELIELLTLRTFVHPGPFDPPGTMVTGLFRTLVLISRWDWRSEPLILQLRTGLDKHAMRAAKQRFKAWRNIDPAMNKLAMFVGSDVDPSGATWTDKKPSKVIAARFTSLATAAANLIQEQGLCLCCDDLFKPALADYDFIIRLDLDLINRASSSAQNQSAFKNLQSRSHEAAHPQGCNLIASLADELEGLYGNRIIFFYDKMDGDVICGLWNPITASTSWKVKLDMPTIPRTVQKDGQNIHRVEINGEGTLGEIARLGGDLIKSIEISSSQ